MILFIFKEKIAARNPIYSIWKDKKESKRKKHNKRKNNKSGFGKNRKNKSDLDKRKKEKNEGKQ